MKLHILLSRILAGLTALWAINITFYLLLVAQVTIQGDQMSASEGQPPVSTPIIQHLSFAQYTGIPGMVAVFAFALLLIAGAYASWRGSLRALILLAVLALVASYVTGFSIGGAFLPGALALAVSAVINGLDLLMQHSKKTTA